MFKSINCAILRLFFYKNCTKKYKNRQTFLISTNMQRRGEDDEYATTETNINILVRSEHSLPENPSDLKFCLYLSHLEDKSGEPSPSHPDLMRIVLGPPEENGETFVCSGRYDPYSHSSTNIVLLKEGLSLHVRLSCMNRHKKFYNSMPWRRHVSHKDLEKMLQNSKESSIELEGSNPNLHYSGCSGTLSLKLDECSKQNFMRKHVVSASFSMSREFMMDFLKNPIT